MNTTSALIMTQQNQRIAEIFAREKSKLGGFIRRRVADTGEAEDILQEVFYQFVQAYRLPAPIEETGAWLYRVARNRIIDRFRRQKSDPIETMDLDEEDSPWLASILASPEQGPEAALARSRQLETLRHALQLLPDEQREVFMANELDGTPMREIAAAMHTSLNTVLARKRYAIAFLRKQLAAAGYHPGEQSHTFFYF